MTTTQAVKQEIPAGTHTVDPVHSSIGFAVIHAGVSTFRGGFGAYEARLTGGDEPGLEGTVDVNSIEIGEEQLKGHLLSPEFFDADRSPLLRFASSELKIGDDGAVSVSGELEIGGQSREVTARGALSRRSTATSTATRGSGSRSRPRSTAATSASTGRPSCRAAARRSTGRSRSRSSSSSSRRSSSDAGARHLRQPARRVVQHGPAAGGRRAAARRGRAGRVRAAGGDPALRRGRRPRAGARRGRARCARRCATPTRS